MTQNEVAAIVKGIGAAVFLQISKSLEQSLESFAARITAVEQRVSSVQNGKDGEPGRDADMGVMLALQAEIATLRGELVAAKSANVVIQQPALSPESWAEFERRMMPFVTGTVTAAVAELPVPKDGKDGATVMLEDVAPLVSAAVEQAVAALPPAKDGAPGRDVDMDDVEALVIKAVAQLPRPKDGTSVTVDELQPLIAGEVQKAISALPVPKDPVGVLGALIDRDGQLVLTLSDGTVKALGAVVGRDVDMAEVARLINAEVALIPRPKDGADGRDGKDGLDGLGFDDLELVTDERGCFLVLARGEQRKEFRLPIVIDRGVYKAGATYQAGDGVTWAGSFWIAQKDTSEKPGEGATGWRLAVKSGREGKVGPEGKPGLNGKDGAPGRDGTKAW